jgi:hypothetical protein
VSFPRRRESTLNNFDCQLDPAVSASPLMERLRLSLKLPLYWRAPTCPPNLPAYLSETQRFGPRVTMCWRRWRHTFVCGIQKAQMCHVGALLAAPGILRPNCARIFFTSFALGSRPLIPKRANSSRAPYSLRLIFTAPNHLRAPQTNVTPPRPNSAFKASREKSWGSSTNPISTMRKKKPTIRAMAIPNTT